LNSDYSQASRPAHAAIPSEARSKEKKNIENQKNTRRRENLYVKKSDRKRGG